jgi:hypothetical protein
MKKKGFERGPISPLSYSKDPTYNSTETKEKRLLFCFDSVNWIETPHSTFEVFFFRDQVPSGYFAIKSNNITITTTSDTNNKQQSHHQQQQQQQRNQNNKNRQ